MKTLDNFYKDTSGLLNRATTCAECRRVHSKQFRQKNTDYYKNYLRDNREALQQYKAQWNRDNYLKSLEYSRKQQERLRQAVSRLYPDDKAYQSFISEQQHVCPVTGSTDVELDHVMPISRGNWGNTRGNLMYLHKPLNTSKSNKNVFNWLNEMEQQTLDYLLPKGKQMTVEEFRQKYLEVLQKKAAEKEMTLEQYEQQYNEDYFEEEK